MEYRCNLVVPGFPKCGTSSFHDYLHVHPDVSMSRPKEPHFFAFNDRYAEGPERHNALFSCSNGTEVYYGESSTIYCVTPQAWERIAGSLKSPKVIILLREPVERAISHYRWMYAQGLEELGPIEAINRFGEDFDPEKPLHGCYKGYLRFSRYSFFVPKWLEAIGREHVHLVFSDELKALPQDVMRSTFAFLGLDPPSRIDAIEQNRTENVKPVVYSQTARLVSSLVPENLKGLVSSSPRLHGLWKRVRTKRKITPPTVLPPEREKIALNLKEDLDFYREMRRQFSVRDEKSATVS